MESESSGARPVRSVVRAFVLLEELARHREGVRLSDLSERCDLSRSTTHNLLATLEHLGYVTQWASAGRYVLTDQAAELGRGAQDSDSELRQRMHPLVARLVSDVGETCYLAVASWRDAVYLDALESPHPLKVGAVTGDRCRLLGTAIGHALLAHRPATARRIQASEPDEWRRWEQAIADARRDGFALDIEQYEPGLSCVAVPVPGYGVARAALCLAGPAGRLPEHRLRELADDMKRRLSSA
ncbi:IclR family transcriptional regulator [Streptomyces carpaticus]|uniref:IclR family transcriptional regulator n=1 Tax=Streptomyces carpaticus TaxID=285558 RepID=A0ABV4ZSL9_9ACTN